MANRFQESAAAPKTSFRLAHLAFLEKRCRERGTVGPLLICRSVLFRQTQRFLGKTHSFVELALSAMPGAHTIQIHSDKNRLAQAPRDRQAFLITGSRLGETPQIAKDVPLAVKSVSPHTEIASAPCHIQRLLKQP